MSIAVAGDWHANLDFADRACARARRLGASEILHLGDFGYDYAGRFAEDLDRILEAHGIERLLFIRGNHDDDGLLRALPRDGDGLGILGERSRWIPDGHRLRRGGRTILALGGAPSIDREWRWRMGAGWWPGEQLDPADAERAIAGGPADIVIAHDVPDRVDVPLSLDQSKLPIAVRADCEEHRRMLGRVADAVRPELWLHGHYHARYASARDGMAVHGLGCDGRSGDALEENVARLDLGDLEIIGPCARWAPPVR